MSAIYREWMIETLVECRSLRVDHKGCRHPADHSGLRHIFERSLRIAELECRPVDMIQVDSYGRPVTYRC